jgi:hypothetical protein
MDEQPIKLDEEGIPVLDQPVDTGITSDQPAASNLDLTNHEIVEKLLANDRIHQLIDDLTDDLQKLVSWKIETILKEELARLIHSAT